MRLMVQKSCVHQLRLVVEIPWFTKKLYIPGGDRRISDSSTVGSMRLVDLDSSEVEQLDVSEKEWLEDKHPSF